MIESAASNAFAIVSIPPMWAWNRSVRSDDWRRSLASKFRPPVVKPPARRISIIPSVICSTDTGNRSTSQPRRSSPALASIDPKMPALHSGRDLVGEVVSGERGVVDLDVDLDVLGEVVALQEGMDGGDVVVVLVLRRLERLGLDQDRAGEADVVLVLDDHREEPAELVELPPHVGVEQRLVPLASAPQHVVVAAEAMRGLEAMGDLARRVGEQLGIRVRRRPGLVARVREQVRRAPQQLHTGAFLVLGGGVDHLVEQGHGLLERRALGRDVAVVEAVERHAELREELERGVHLLARRGDRVGARGERRMPRSIERAGPEDVEPVPREAVPVADREPQVILHPAARHDAVGVVPPKRQRVVAVRPLEGDRRRRRR